MLASVFFALPTVQTLSGSLFWILSLLVVSSAMLVVFNRSPVDSALALALTMVFSAMLMIRIEAYFIGTVQVLVYAGAVMVLFLFIIMLLDIRAEERRRPNLIAVFGGAVVFSILAAVFYATVRITPAAAEPIVYAGIQDDVRLLGISLFGKYLLPFALTSVLLLVAIVGVILLCRTEKTGPTGGRE